MPCETAKEGVKGLLAFFKNCLDADPESDGILLVLLHSEQLMDLMREIWLLKNKRYIEKFSVVKGVCFVEEIVRCVSYVFGPDPIFKLQRKILLLAGIRPFTSVK